MAAKKKPGVAKQACINASLGARDVRNKVNGTWTLARKAPMFTRKKVSVNEIKITKADEKKLEGKSQKEKEDFLAKKKERHLKITRTNRLVGKHAYNVAAAGAAAYVREVMKQEASVYRIGVRKESHVGPWYPQVSDGAAAMLEQFLSAYAQEATRNAAIIRKVVSTGKRLNGKLMKLGYEATDDSIFASTTAVPQKILWLAARKPPEIKLTEEEKAEVKGMSSKEKAKFLKKKRAEARAKADDEAYVPPE
ncbi:MAG: hypothetical protein CMI16_04845 [Opitutaceae bacterium]|nr:hypothetical protein [Opitutaceae bacterium]|tara:strand:- start:1109 stop:1861 length:753 start_codon:yes stop_codon:yes gene_type:complete